MDKLLVTLAVIATVMVVLFYIWIQYEFNVPYSVF